MRPLGLLPILALTALIAPFIPAPPGSVHWHGAQTVCTEVGAVLLLMALLCHPWRLSSLTAFGLNRCLPFVFLSLLFLWGLVSCLLSPTPFAVQGLLLLGVGVLVAGVTAAQANSTSRVLLAAASVMVPAVLVALSGFAQIGNGKTLAVGVLQDHQLFGAFLLISIPLCLSLSLAPGTLTQRLVGQASFAICLLGLAESQHRSAWIGAVVSLIVFGFLWLLRDTSRSETKLLATDPKRMSASSVVPLILLFFVLLGMIALLPDRERLIARLFTVQRAAQNRDYSMQWRQSVWEGTRKMISERPFLGWGIGSFPLYHNSYTHTGYTRQRVQLQGPSVEDEAHNSYLQIWAEMGIAGLLFWLGAFFSLLGTAVQSLRRLKRGSLEQWLLIGGMSAVAGQMTDALANPAWQFGNILLPLWIIFGLTAALSAPSRAAQIPPTLPLFWRIAQCSFATALALWLLSLVWRTAFALPAPHL